MSAGSYPPGRVPAIGNCQLTWEDVLTQIINETLAVTGGQLSEVVDRAVRPWELTAELLAVYLAPRLLTPVRPQPGERWPSRAPSRLVDWSADARRRLFPCPDRLLL